MPLVAAPKKALIFGVSGQDGTYLADLLLRKGYAVWGTTRRPAEMPANLRRMGLAERVTLLPTEMQEPGALAGVLRAVAPDEIYNLAGQTSVSMSFEQPYETARSVAHCTLALLEAMRTSGVAARMFHASSAECFGDHGEARMSEATAFRPRSPYGVAKAAAHWHVASYRECFGLYVCSGILFNHESPLRPAGFVTQKIVAAVSAIARGTQDKLQLGALEVYRDWGWAPEYVEAMWAMLQGEAPEDFVLATGETHSLREFAETAFALKGMRAADHVVQDRSLLRPTETQWSFADPSRAAERLGWRAQLRMEDVIRGMMEAEDERQREPETSAAAAAAAHA